MLIDKTYQHRNFVGNRLTGMLISGNYEILGRSVYKDLPLYKEIGRVSVKEFIAKHSIHGVDVDRCIEIFCEREETRFSTATVKDKISIGIVSKFIVFNEFDLISAFNYCVEHDLVFTKEYMSLSEYLRAVGKNNLNAWNAILKKVKKGRVPGLKLDAILDPSKEGDYKSRASYLYRFDDLQAISKHFDK